MKTAVSILKRDLLALVKNPIALLVVGALLVLPGLYAWYCIVANWDPYSNTKDMPIAVVNNDRGAHSNLTGEINIGVQVVEKLEENDSIKWVFYDSEEEALNDTGLSLCYATLVLPEDLSENVVGIFAGSDKTPTIYYYPNEKHNAVATKVTDAAAQTLVRQINQGFSSTVNKTLLASAKKAADEVEQKASEANSSAIAEIKSVQADLEKIIVSLDDALIAIDGWRATANGASSALAVTAEQLPAIRAQLSNGAAELDSLRANTGDFESGLSATILNSASTISNLSNQASSTLSQASQDLEVLEERLSAVADAARSDVSLKTEVDLMESITSLINSIVSGVGGRVADMNARMQETAGSVYEATSQISNEVVPQLNAGTYALTTSFSQLSGALGQFEPQIASLQNVLAQTDSALVSSVGAINDAKTLLGDISNNLRSTVADIGAIGKALEVEKIKDLLDADPENVGTFISTPVQMVTEVIAPVSNYGTAVAPFYTNLALWIGCFILVSLMKVEVSGFPATSARQRFFGRWLLFVILSFLQSQVICGVDILLGIDCVNPVAFMVAGAVCSFAYMNLIYALTKTFRNVGKTLCILLLIMQVPGSSGMYPIEMMPGFFQFIHPVLPFTYGIDAMREALSGMYGLDYFWDLAVLLLIVPASLLVGLGLRPAMGNLLLLFDEEMNKAGFFASEAYEGNAGSSRMRGLIRALSAHDSYRDDIEERSWRFNRMYPRARKALSIIMFAIPLVVLVIMLPLNMGLDLSTDSKLAVIVAMLALLLVMQFGLIVLEYIHRSIITESRALGASLIGEEWDLNELFASSEEPEGETDEALEKPASALRGSVALDIFMTDLRLGFQSVIGVVVVMLLVVTPSMYAWFNIAGSWDPYSSTGNLRVAVANEDAGYKGELVPMTINIGDTIESQLRGNANFDWVFVDKAEAISGVESSKYYAAIEIPSDFSSNMMTYLTDDADYPKVVYYTNEKENPIAPIITQKGADSIQENIRQNFTERVDTVVLGVAYDVLSYVKNPKMSTYAVKMSKHLDDALANVRGASRELRSLSSLSQTVSSIVDATSATFDGMQMAGDSAKGAISEAKNGVSNSAKAFDRAVAIVHNMLDSREMDVSKIQSLIDGALSLMQDAAQGVPARIDGVIENVENLRDKHTSKEVPADLFDAVITSLVNAQEHAKAIPSRLLTARSDLDALVQNAQAEVKDARNYFNNTVEPSIAGLRSTMSNISDSTSVIVNALESSVDGIGSNTNGLSNQLNSLSVGLENASGKLDSAAKNVEDVKARVAAALTSGDLSQIEAVVLGSDPERMASRLAVPLQEERKPLYPVANFGSAMAAFYTVLALWVGALVMISTMRVHVVEDRIEELCQRYRKVRPRHEFCGRYGIFGFIGLMQSALVLLGDLFLLHIQCDHPVLFFIFGILIGQLFCIIVYTITELFGDVGKALCVILLIMQVAASGGTFPVEMLHPILLSIVDFLPFYHAMSLLQECVAGIQWLDVVINMAALLVMAGVILIIGLPLRRPFRKMNDFFERQLEKTGYM